VLKRLRNKKEPLVITQWGRAAAVIISVEAYEKSENEKEEPRNWNYGNAIHHSHTILGQVALRLGDIDGNG
jgi:prevent-host-death family protein